MIKWINATLYKTFHWETWHYHLKYIPLYPAWLWYCLRSGSLWFFTPSNPSLTFGGFEGETKSEMYQLLPDGSYPTTMVVNPGDDFDSVLSKINKANFTFPFIVKPDIGMMGFLFRKIPSSEALKLYHERMPVNYLVQTLVNYPIEVSVFYYRFPTQQKGTITGFIRKEYLQVTGDGRSTLGELMEAYPRVRFRLEEMKAKHSLRLNDVIPEGESYNLSLALNLSRGGKLISLENEKDDRLLKIFDQLSHHSGTIFYGRYDIKCRSIDDLKQGTNYSILEFNGSGAEPHHVYGNGNTLFRAYSILLEHWKVLYGISRYNHNHGFPYWDFKKGYRFLKNARRHFRELKRLDIEMPVFS